MDRRRFLKQSIKGFTTVGLSSSLAQLYSSTLFAQQTLDYRAVVCLFLDGGLDCNNTVIPMDGAYSQYAAGRQDLKLAQGSLSALKPTSQKRLFGLHTNLPKTAALFNSGDAAILANVGTIARPTRKTDTDYGNELPTNLFSHSSQIGAWDTALAASVASTGWAGRVADALQSSLGSGKMPAVVSTCGYSLLGQGASTNQLTAATGNASTTALVNTLSSLQQYFAAAENCDGCNNIQKYLSAQQQQTLSSSRVLSDTYASGTIQTPFPTSGIGQQLYMVAKMIAGRSAHNTTRQIFTTADGSYDTHTDQIRILNDRLPAIDEAIAAFVAAMKEIGMHDKVTLFTCSDFGRTLVQNGTGGTDHAWGGHHFVVGGAVKGGDMYGTFPDLVPGGSDDYNNLGNWIPTTGTTQYMATMANWLGVSAADLPTVFPELPNFQTQTVSMLRA